MTSNVSAVATTPRSGTHVAKLFGGFNGANNASGLMQNRVSGGNVYWQAKAYVRHNSDDSLAGTANYLLIKIEFYNTPGAAYGSSAMLQDTGLTVLTAATPTDRWTPVEFQMRAPTGTVEARIAFVFIQPSGQGGAALIDDVSFEPVLWPWTLVWRDEFDAPPVDVSKWNVVDGYTGGNNEMNWYAPDDVYVESGDLVLRSQARWYNGKPYTSGQVTTWGKFAPRYGRIEVRAKLPPGRGMWPAHWMLSQFGGWPPEIDIMELIGSVPNCVVMSHHWGPLPPGVYPWDIGQTANTTYCGPNYTDGYHTYAVDWSPGLVHWYVDGALRFSSIRSQVPDDPMYLILNTAVGGNWPGPPDGSTPLPGYHRIDYVRVYASHWVSDPLSDWRDAGRYGAATDGVVGDGEYVRAAEGINSGSGGVIGAGARLHIDSDGDGRLQIGLESVAAWQPIGSRCVVVYLDTQAGGVSTTQLCTDTTDIWPRAISGRAPSGARSDLHFAPGFLPDYAVVIGTTFAGVYRVGNAEAHTRLNGATIDAASDINGGAGFVFRSDGGSAGNTMREVSLRLADIGLADGDSLRFMATLVTANTASRSNEFLGVASGNVFDSANPGAATVLLKRGDFLRFTTAHGLGDADLDGDVDAADLAALAPCLTGPATGEAAPPASTCLEPFDSDGDSAIDLADFAIVQRRAGF